MAVQSGHAGGELRATELAMARAEEQAKAAVELEDLAIKHQAAQAQAADLMAAEAGSNTCSNTCSRAAAYTAPGLKLDVVCRWFCADRRVAAAAAAARAEVAMKAEALLAIERQRAEESRRALRHSELYLRRLLAVAACNTDC